MQLDQHRIAIRERGHLEVLDLSLRVAASHAAPLAAAFLAGILPLAVANSWLLSDVARSAAEGEFPGEYLWYMLVLVVWETPVATALATLYLGQAMFMQRAEAARIARGLLVSLPQLFLYQVVLRGMLMLPVVTWFVPATFWPYLNEIILLERNPLRAGRTNRVTTYRRMTSLHGGLAGDLFGRWVLSILIGAALLASFWFSMWFLAAILLNAWAWEGPAYTVCFPIAFWLVVALFAVARFLGYLDLRIRREGWEVELLMRAEEPIDEEADMKLGMGVVMVFVAAAVAAQIANCSSLLVAANPDDSVQSGRRALDSWAGYPWYDPKNDDIRRVEPPPPPPPPPSFDWSDFGPILQVLAWIAIGVGLGVVLYLLWRAFLLRPKDQEAGEAEAEAGHAARIESLPFPVAQGRRDLLAEARRHYEQGNYRQAIIYLFSFQLLRLDKQQIIHLAKGKTNRQYLREVGPRQTLRRIIEQTMVAFEDVFFGNHAIDRERFESCWSRVGEFERLTAET